MVVITNNWDISELDSTCNEIDIRSVKMDINMLKEQYESLEQATKKCKDNRKKNIGKRLIKEYNKIIKNVASDGTLEICWKFDVDHIASYPVLFLEEKNIGIRVSDAIVTDGNTKIVSIKIKDLLNLIAFEYGREQIGFNMEILESRLKNIGITGLHSVEELRSDISSIDSCYRDVKGLVVVCSEYCDNNGNLQGYFNVNSYGICSQSTYDYAISRTCNIVSSIVALKTVRGIIKHDSRAALLNVGKDRITFSASIDTDVHKYLDDYIIKVAGRQFILEMEIEESM